MLNDLTIIVITYNRYCYLKRLLSYYLSFEADLKILVLDSSSISQSDGGLRTLLSHENVVWRRYDSTIFFTNKIYHGSGLVYTPYAVLCADDDFLFVEALEKAVCFLRKNQDYSSCQGLKYKHHVYDVLSKKDVVFTQSAIGGISCEYDSARQRVESYLSGETVHYPFYAVHSTKDFKKIWSETSAAVSDYGLSEIFPCSVSLCLGKMKVLPIPYATREPNTFSWCTKDRRNEMYSAGKVDRVVSRLAELISVSDGNSLSESFSAVYDAVQSFLLRVHYDKSELSIGTVLGRMDRFIPLVSLAVFVVEFRRFISAYLIRRPRLVKNINSHSGSLIADVICENDCDSDEIVISRQDYVL